MIILNELILKLNEKWYDRCRTGKEAIYEYRVFKIFCRAGKTAALRKSGKSAEYFPAGAQPCDQDTGGRVRCSALPERRTKREPEPLRKRIDAGCRGDSGRISSNGGAGRQAFGRKKRQCGSEPYIRSRQEQYHICCGNSARPSRLSSTTA